MCACLKENYKAFLKYVNYVIIYTECHDTVNSRK